MLATETLRQIDNARHAIIGLRHAWYRATLSDAYTEIVRRLLDDAEFCIAEGDYDGAQDAVTKGWAEMGAGS